MPQPQLVLWDIDGTLLRGGEIAPAVFDRALEHVLGATPTERIRMSGKTDPQIVREYLNLMGSEDPDALTKVLVRAEAELALAKDAFEATARPCAGAREVLESLADRPWITQTIVSGNLKPNALVKLNALGFDRFVDFEIGAYGSDNEDRNCLVPIALERAAALRQLTFEPDQVWVIGDTPYDFACAQAGGVRCLLVATGRFSYEELEPLGAEATFADLTDTARVVELIGSPLNRVF